MDDVMPRRRKAGGTHPGITTAEVRRPLQTENSKSLFKKGNRYPTETEKRMILAKCIEVAIVTCMSNHMYTFNKETYMQVEGGSIAGVYNLLNKTRFSCGKISKTPDIVEAYSKTAYLEIVDI